MIAPGCRSNDYSAMKVHEWLASRNPPPPPALAARINESVAGFQGNDLPFDVFVNAAQAILATLPDGRQGALDLLAADALLTYAFEVSAEECGSMDDRADTVITRIASLA